MLRDIQNNAPNILSEMMVRIIVLAIVCLMHTNLQPFTQHFTEAELIHVYKRPIRESLTPPWLMIILIIFVPIATSLIPYIQSRNYVDMTQTLLAWSLACAINAFLTETGKLVVGRPRPDFFYRCFPNEKITKDLRCTGDFKDVIEGRKSFPSGHSSYSFCSLGFVSVWMCGKLGVLSRCRGHGMRVVGCLIPLVVASLVALSRFCDNHHHWEDVFVGSTIGFSASYFCYRQYYHPLNSLQSGTPYLTRITDTLFRSKSEYECCTKDLEPEKIHDKDKYLMKSNKKNY